MKIKINWEVTPKEAIELQKKLQKEVKIIPLKKQIKYIGGADVSMSMFAKEGFAGFVTLSSEDLTMVDHSVVKEKINFPYIPGLLSFREVPMLIGAWENLKKKPDLIVVDGVGIAHPRRLGIASHLGIILGVPTIGCAKSVLTGVYKEPKNKAGSISYLYDKTTKEIIGAALRTKENVKPVFISPGHLVTLEEAITVVLKCIKKHRLPEPTRLTHNAVNEYRIRAENKNSSLI